MWIEVVEKSDSDIDMSKKRGDSAVHNHNHDHQVDVGLSLSGIESRKSKVESRMLKVESRMLKIGALSVCPFWHAVATEIKCPLVECVHQMKTCQSRFGEPDDRAVDVLLAIVPS